MCFLTAFAIRIRNVTLHHDSVCVVFFRNFLTALIIASAPFLTLNPTCCSCISAMVWSECWSTATDSISFRGVSRSAIGSNFVLFDPSGLSTSLVSGTMLARSHSRFSSLFARPIIHTWAQFTNELSPSGTYRSAFKWEFLVLDLPGSAPLFIISSLAGTLLLESGLIFQASLLHSSISSFIFVHSPSGKSSLGSFAWIIFVVSSPGVACLLASQHDLFRRSQASVVCFEDCSVHFPEVRLFFVLQLVGVRVFLSSSSCCFMSAL